MEKIRGLSEEHEVLTPDNYWVKIKDLDSNSRIAQWDHETSEISFVKPDEIHEWDYEGDMINLVNGKIEQIITPFNYIPMHYPYDYKSKYRFEACEAKLHGSTAVPFSGIIKDNGRIMADLERLYIAVQADGSICSEKYTGERTGMLHYKFGFHKGRKVERLKMLCNNLNFEIKEVNLKDDGSNKRSFYIYVPKDLYRRDVKNFRWFNIEELSPQWIESFIEELTHWDGNTTKDGYKRYITSNPDTMMIASTLSQLANIKSHVYVVKPRKNVVMPNGGISDTKEAYQVGYYNKSYAIGSGIKRKTIPNFKGKVYNVKVPTGFILTRLGYKISIAGSC